MHVWSTGQPKRYVPFVPAIVARALSSMRGMYA